MDMDSQYISNSFNVRASSFFGDLSFKEETHEYFIGKEKTPQSVSGLVKQFVQETDWDAIATAIAKRDKRNKQDILDEWAAKNKLACDNGTRTHSFAENLNSKSVPRDLKEEAVIKFWKDLNRKNPGRYTLLTKELPMYHKIYKFPGTCDFILYDKLTRMYIIGDYKTNEDLFKNYKEKKLLFPFDFLLDCPYNHYQIQLSFYQILLEQLNYLVSERWIVYLEADGNYTKYNCYNYTEYLFNWLDTKVA